MGVGCCKHCVLLILATLSHTQQDAHTAPAAFVNRTQLCFAVRGGVDSLLDVARTTFCETTAAIQEFAHHYQQDTGHLGEIKACGGCTVTHSMCCIVCYQCAMNVQPCTMTHVLVTSPGQVQCTQWLLPAAAQKHPCQCPPTHHDHP